MTHAELTAAGFNVDAAAHARLSAFVDALLAENQKLNLTAIRDPAAAWVSHVCESLLLAPLIVERGADTVVDLGAGGGVPGIPLACALPDARFTLVDATRKKIDAARRIVATLGLTNVVCVAGRAEVLAHDPEYRERFDALVARAVAPLPELIELSSGFVRPGGTAWFFKTPRALQDEIPSAAGAAEACRMAQVAAVEASPAAGARVSLVLSYKKWGPLPRRLPRGVGTPKTRPL